MTTDVKHPQFILAVKTTYLTQVLKCHQGFNDLSWEDFIRDIQAHTVLAQRNMLENDPSFMQLLPYIVITAKDRPDLVYAYQRTKQVGESRLGGAHSIGGGGHIDFQDSVSSFFNTNVIEVEETIKRALKRELFEEFKFAYKEINGRIVKGIPLFDEDNLHFKGVITDWRRDVEKVHVALVFFYEIESFDIIDVQVRENELIHIGPMSLMRETSQNAENAGKFHEGTFEPWSVEIIKRGLSDARAMRSSNGYYDNIPFTVQGSSPVTSLLLDTPIAGLSTAEYHNYSGGFPGLSAQDLGQAFPDIPVIKLSDGGELAINGQGVVKGITLEEHVSIQGTLAPKLEGTMQLHLRQPGDVVTITPPVVLGNGWRGGQDAYVPGSFRFSVQTKDLGWANLSFNPLGLSENQAQDVVRLLQEGWKYGLAQLQFAKEQNHGIYIGGSSTPLPPEELGVYYTTTHLPQIIQALTSQPQG